MENDIPVFRTSDVNLAAALLCLQHDVIGIDTEDANRVVFYFKYDLDLKTHVDGYWNDTLRVSPKTYMSCRKDLITRMTKSEVYKKEE
jgi:hypothetical protein